MSSGMCRRSVVPSFVLVQAVLGLGVSRLASAQEPVTPEVEAQRCAGADETLLPPILKGDEIDSVEPLYGASSGEGAPDRLIGATIKVKAPGNTPAAAIKRALECDAARRTLGRPDVLTAPNDPFWAAGHTVAIDVAAARDGYRVVVRAADPLARRRSSPAPTRSSNRLTPRPTPR